MSTGGPRSASRHSRFDAEHGDLSACSSSIAFSGVIPPAAARAGKRVDRIPSSRGIESHLPPVRAQRSCGRPLRETVRGVGVNSVTAGVLRRGPEASYL